MQIRSATSDDIAAIIGLSSALGLSPWSEAGLAAEIGLEDAVMICAKNDDGSLAGFAVGRTCPASSREGTDAELYNIGVFPAEQRSGIGSALLAEFVGRASARNAGQIWLEVRRSNSSAVAFYEKHGFRIADTRRGFYTAPPDDALVLVVDMSGTGDVSKNLT
jgi:ribosomal-protein-alanine N-acetyltransferase